MQWYWLFPVRQSQHVTCVCWGCQRCLAMIKQSSTSKKITMPVMSTRIGYDRVEQCFSAGPVPVMRT